MVIGKELNRNLLLEKVINYYLFKHTCIIFSERWPVTPISLLHRLSYATYSQFCLQVSAYIDLHCNEQNHMKISQQSHSTYFTSSAEMVLTENILQKLSIIVTQKIILDILEHFCDVQRCWSGRVIQLCHVHISVM